MCAREGSSIDITSLHPSCMDSPGVPGPCANWAWNYLTFQRGTRLITGISGSRMEDMERDDGMLQPSVREVA